jgi:predicted nucleotidyltransferase
VKKEMEFLNPYNLAVKLAPAFMDWNIHKVILFGSFARSDCHSNSDVDLIVESGNDDVFLGSSFKETLERLTGHFVEILSPESIDLEDELKASIAREGIVIHDLSDLENTLSTLRVKFGPVSGPELNNERVEEKLLNILEISDIILANLASVSKTEFLNNTLYADFSLFNLEKILKCLGRLPEGRRSRFFAYENSLKEFLSPAFNVVSDKTDLNRLWDFIVKELPVLRINLESRS